MRLCKDKLANPGRFAALILLACANQAHAEIVYFTTSSSGPPLGTSLAAVVDNGTNAHALLGLGGPGRSLAVDPIQGKLYFGFESVGIGARLARTNLDGTGFQTILTTGFHDFELDLIGGKMYLTAGAVVRANLDGSGLEILFQPPLSGFAGIAVDHSSNSLFIGDSFTNSIIRTDLDGQNPLTVIQFSQNVDLQDVEIDLIDRKLYWTDLLLNKIQRSNLDGTNIEDVVVDDNGRRLAIDHANGKLYWGTTNPASFGPGLYRANRDGSGIELVLADSNINDIHGIDVGPVAVVATIPTPSTFILLGGGALFLAGGLFYRQRVQCTRRSLFAN